MAVPDLATETGERRTESTSSGFDFRTDTQSAEVLQDAGTESASLNFEEDNDEANSAASVPRAPAAATQVHHPSKTTTGKEKAKETVVRRETKESAAAAASQTSKKEETALCAGGSKQKLYSDVDSSCSENVTPRSLNEADNTSSNPKTDSASSPVEAVVPAVKPMPPKQSNATRLAQEYRVGDMAPVLVKGSKYVFDNHNMRWKTYDVTVRILHPNRGVDQDNYFAIFSAELLDPVKAAAPVFAKVYRRNISDVAEADYFSLGQAQALCEEFARDYTRQKPRPGYPKYRLPLLTNRVVVRLNMKSVLDPAVRNAQRGFFSYRTQDTRQMMFFMEPNTVACAAVGASFTSPEVDDGKCYPQGDPSWPRQVYSDIADGLSHFSFVQSREKMVMHGFLRSNGYLLDPLFHTTDREGFRMGDGGKKAIDQWIKQHRCGDTCRALGIRSFSNDVVDVSAAAAFNPLANTENHYTDYLRCVRQMRVVVRIALDVPDFSGDDTDNDFESLSPTESISSVDGAALAASLATPSFPVTLNAIKYVFLPARARWEEVPMKMTVLTPNKPVTSDERNAVFSIEEVRNGTESIPMRAKFILRPGAKDADYYHVGDAYCVCVALGQVFRGYRKNGVFERELEFRSAYAVRVPQTEIPESIKAHMRDTNFFAHTTADSGDVMFVLEPDYTSDAPRRAVGAGGMPMDAEGFDDRELRQVVDAFSHFTLHKSGNHLLVCHLKCKDGLLTRPHINTSNGRGFETINDGERGIRHWVKHHTCNPLCKLLGMEPLPPRLKLYNISNSKLMTYINLVQQHALSEDEKVDFNLPSRPPSEMISRFASEQRQARAAAAPPPQPAEKRKELSTASIEQSRNSNGISATESPLAMSPVKDDSEPLLRPWVHTGKGAIPNYPAKKNGVLAAGPRRPLTQADLTKLQSRGIETKYILPATKYEYDINTLSWRMHRLFVRVVAPERGIGQGGMRVCFEVMDIDPVECEETVMVAKMYRRTIKDVVEKDYFTEVAVQKLCSLFAQDFNAEKKDGCDERLNVLDSAVIAIERADLNPELLAKKTGFFSYRTTDSQRLMFSVEARLVGRFTKYNGNMGEAYPTNESRLSPAAARERTRVFEAVEALSHYSLVKSEGGLLVCDMQGVKNDLTDLEVHTYDGQGLGIGNFGARGIEKFVDRHRCTSVCKALHLEPLREQKFEVTEEVKRNNKFVRIFERSKEIDKMP
jgi:myosin-heavy-chain kinase